jgi:hypothetical protein
MKKFLHGNVVPCFCPKHNGIVIRYVFGATLHITKNGFIGIKIIRRAGLLKISLLDLTLFEETIEASRLGGS